MLVKVAQVELSDHVGLVKVALFAQEEMSEHVGPGRVAQVPR